MIAASPTEITFRELALAKMCEMISCFVLDGFVNVENIYCSQTHYTHTQHVWFVSKTNAGAATSKS